MSGNIPTSLLVFSFTCTFIVEITFTLAKPTSTTAMSTLHRTGMGVHIVVQLCVMWKTEKKENMSTCCSMQTEMRKTREGGRDSEIERDRQKDLYLSLAPPHAHTHTCVFCFSHSGLFFKPFPPLCARMRQSWFVCMYLATCGCRWGVSYLQCACVPFRCDFNLSVCVYIHGCPLHAQSLNRAVFVMSHENSHIVEQSEQKALGLSSEQRVMTHCVTCSCLCVLWGFFWVGFFFRLVTSVL